jgi:rhodanese-related sulfurtransferase
MGYNLDLKVLAGLEPISSLSPVRLSEILDHCQLVNVPKGNFVVQDMDDQAVYLVDGELELVYQDGNRVVVNAQSEWAKYQLGKYQPHIVSALALCECQLLRLDGELLDRIVALDHLSKLYSTKHSMAVAGLEDRIDATTSLKQLLNSSMFCLENIKKGPLAHLPVANINALLQRIEAISALKDDIIIREGEEGDYYYLVDSGSAKVTRHIGGVDILLANLKEGGVFGEEALVADVKRNATVTMTSNGILWRIGRQDFLALLQEPLLQKVSYEQALSAIDQGAIWLDVRYPSEYRHDKLNGAVNVPLNDVRNAIDVLDRTKKYIVYCQSGRRSAAAAFILAQSGYDVSVLDGGLWSVSRLERQ